MYLEEQHTQVTVLDVGVSQEPCWHSCYCNTLDDWFQMSGCLIQVSNRYTMYYLCIYYQERHCIWGDKVWYPWVVDGEVGQGLVHILQVQDKGGKGGRGGGEPVLWGGGAAASLWWGRRERMCRVLEWFCRERVADVEEEDHSEKTLLREKQMTNWLVSTDV